MRRALTVGAPFLTRFANALSVFDRTVRPFAHIAQSSCSSRGKKTTYCGNRDPRGDPTPPPAVRQCGATAAPCIVYTRLYIHVQAVKVTWPGARKKDTVAPKYC
jgi:hypothetical protein